MAQAAAELELSCFVYFSAPHRSGVEARLISNYPIGLDKALSTAALSALIP
jgi:hypothetical protein